MYDDNVALPAFGHCTLCCFAHAAVVPGSCHNRSISPACRAHSSRPTAVVCRRWMGQTDERMPNSCIDRAPHTMQAVLITSDAGMLITYQV